MNAETDDLTLLRRFEPIVRFTRGERFFPTDVEPYVRACSLWVQRPEEEPVCLIPEGQLTLDHLARPHPDEFGAVHFLKLTEPLTAAQMAAYNLQRLRIFQDSNDVFRAGRGRLARVGYVSRLFAALFSITLLARGRVPGDSAVAAAIAYKDILAEDEHYCYHGRVIRDGNWIILQYWFFYLFNSWRSGYSGANDHEADWEMICIYLSQKDRGEVKPEWVAYASHNYHGDDLRRRWDDPELETVGEHPVVYAGAGSHASYYGAGEYLTELELPFLTPLARATRRFHDFWYETLRQYRAGDPQADPKEETSLFHIPFVDYARGDGVTIGPGQEKTWTAPRVLSPPPAWVMQYRGLWGLYARDVTAGEDAPAGPMYNRDGTVRRSWYDPLGWAGLDKVSPSTTLLDNIGEQQAQLKAQQEALISSVEEKTRQLEGLGTVSTAMRHQPHMSEVYERHQKRIADLSQEVDQLRAQMASDQALLESLALYAQRMRAGEREPARAHLSRPHRAASDEALRVGRLAEIWAAVSIGLMLIGLVAMTVFARDRLIPWLIAIVALFVFIESSVRGKLTRLVASVTAGLAAVSALIIVYEFFWQTVLAAVVVAGVYILWENLRELWT